MNLSRVLQYPRLCRYYDAETRVRFVALIAAVGDVSILSARRFLAWL